MHDFFTDPFTSCAFLLGFYFLPWICLYIVFKLISLRVVSVGSKLAESNTKILQIKSFGFFFFFSHVDTFFC